MLKVENIVAFNLEGAIRGMRQPYKGLDKSDSYMCDAHHCETCEHNGDICIRGTSPDGLVIGEKDLDLAQRLIKSGSPHDKFMRQIGVSMDITAPLYWWKEMDTYKVGTVANSESTMHTIMKSEFTPDMFSYDESFYHNTELTVQTGMTVLQQDIILLNVMRRHYMEETNPVRKKAIWRTIIQKLPSSYLQQRTYTSNYSICRAQDAQRENHRLTEWAIFRHALLELPYSRELIFYERELPEIPSVELE